MDYFSVIILVIVAFTFASDRKIKDLNTISKSFPKAKSKTQNVITNLNIIKCNMETITYDRLIQIAKESNKKYILLESDMLNLSKENIKILVANYIVASKIICGFNPLYTYDDKNKVTIIRKLYINGINYLNIFDRRYEQFCCNYTRQRKTIRFK